MRQAVRGTYGPGWAKRMAANRRSAQHVRQLDAREIGGIVARAEEALGFGDPRAIQGTPERLRWLAQLWFTHLAAVTP